MELSLKKTLLLFLVCLSVVFLYLFFISGFPIREAFETGSVINQIVFELRLPRLFFVLAVGGVLSVLGGAYQVLFRNPLAEPYVLGVSSAVSLVAAICHSLFQWALNSLPMLALGCVAGLLTASFLLFLGRVTNQRSTERLILFGMSLNFVLSSILFLFLTYASQQLGGGTMQWLFGHIPWVSLSEGLQVLVLSVFVVGIWVAWGRQLDVMGLGDTVAKTSGVSPSFVRMLFITSSSLFLGIVVTQTGAIGFVGLVIPHAVRLAFRPRSSRALFILSFLVGGSFLLFCDLVSRNLLPPMEFPIGIVTTLVGAPLFLWLLWKR